MKLVVLGRRRGGDRLPRPAGEPRAEAREHPRHRQQGRGLQGSQGGHGPEQGALRAGTRARGRSPTSSPAPTSSSGCRPAACSSRRWSSRWPTSRSSWRWRIPSRRSGPSSRRRSRPDCLIGTGRSDYPNQVNNSLCFPFIFRGALDVGATTINEEMKLAAVRALAELAQAEPSEIVALAYGEQTPAFGPDYLIPRAFDPAADHQDGARRSRRPRWTAASRRGRSRTSTPIATSSTGSSTSPAPRWSRCSPRPSRRRSASCTPKARTSACCARRRSRWTRGSRDRCSSAVRTSSRPASPSSACV